MNYILTHEVFSSFIFRHLNLYLDPLSFFYLYLMSIDQIGLNLWIEGESIASGLQDFQSLTNPFTFDSVKNPQLGSDRRIFCAPLVPISLS